MRITGAPGKRPGEASRSGEASSLPQAAARSAAAIIVLRKLITRGEDHIGDAILYQSEEVVVPEMRHAGYYRRLSIRSSTAVRGHDEVVELMMLEDLAVVLLGRG